MVFTGMEETRRRDSEGWVSIHDFQSNPVTVPSYTRASLPRAFRGSIRVSRGALESWQICRYAYHPNSTCSDFTPSLIQKLHQKHHLKLWTFSWRMPKIRYTWPVKASGVVYQEFRRRVRGKLSIQICEWWEMIQPLLPLKLPTDLMLFYSNSLSIICRA